MRLNLTALLLFNMSNDDKEIAAVGMQYNPKMVTGNEYQLIVLFAAPSIRPISMAATSDIIHPRSIATKVMQMCIRDDFLKPANQFIRR